MFSGQIAMMIIPICVMILLATMPFSAAQSNCNMQCQEFTTVTQCASQAYSLTGFPNFFEHPNLDEAKIYATFIDAGVEYNCYAQTRELLCGTLFPECRPNEGLVFPSKSICADFLVGCEAHTPLLTQAGLEVNCDKFDDQPTPICYNMTTPVITTPVMTTKGAMTPRKNTPDDADDGKQNCPDKDDPKCAGISINLKTSGFLLMCLMVFVSKIVLLE